MKAAAKQVFRPEDDTMFAYSRYAKNLKNYALYIVRQYYFENKKMISESELKKICKDNINYKLLQSQSAQSVIEDVIESFKSFFALLKKKNKGNYDKPVHIPRYMKKSDNYVVTYKSNSLSIANGYIYIPTSRFTNNIIKNGMPEEIKEETYCNVENFSKNIRVKIPDNIIKEEYYYINEITFIPKHKGRLFEVVITYDIIERNIDLSKNNLLSIDIGINNFASCISNNLEAPFLIDGRVIKSINQGMNKKVSKLTSIYDRLGINRNQDRINSIRDRRNNIIRDFIFKSARYIINTCIENDIGTLIVGYNKNWKQEVEMYKNSKQNFVFIPHKKFIDQLEFLCKKYGLKFISREESYTSKSSFINDDFIPTYEEDIVDLEPNIKYNFSGKRIFRGLYKTRDGIILNADINGACNIARKAGYEDENLKSICTLYPKRIKIYSKKN